MRIRHAIADDVSTCVRLLHAPGLELPDGMYADESLIANYLPDLFFVATMRGGAVVGCVIGERVRAGALVWFLAVHPDHRRRGTGTKLLAAFEEEARSSGADWILLSAPLEVPAASSFYDACGYALGGSFAERKKRL